MIRDGATETDGAHELCVVGWGLGPLDAEVRLACGQPRTVVASAVTTEDLWTLARRSAPCVLVIGEAAVPAHELETLVREMRHTLPDASVVLFLEQPDELRAGRFLQNGGHEVVDWPRAGRTGLSDAIARSAERSRLLARVRALELEVHRRKRSREVRDWVEASILGYRSRSGFRGMIGHSEKMQELYERVERVAQYPDMNVTVLGERGTGKSLVAKAVHELGPRGGRPFQKFLCSRFQSADPKITMCELFGWGADPPVRDLARSGGRGLLESASGGTLFLDELGDIPALGQNLLLDVVESKAFTRPLGKPTSVTVEVRFLFATNRSPRELVERGGLREDFWDRISEIVITVPPLRQRTEDIPLLIQHFINQYSPVFNRHVRSLTDRAVERLTKHPWPGNVRELESAVKRALLLCDGEVIDERDLELRTDDADALPLDALIDRLWALVSAGRMVFGDVVEFKVSWGAEITRRVIERAVSSTRSLKQAGTVLGVYSDAESEQARYSKFRSDVARLRESAGSPPKPRRGGRRHVAVP